MHYDNERESELNNEWLIHGDCFEKMKLIKTGSVDVILTDPPYELSKSKGGGMMGKGGRKFMQEVKEHGMIDGINTELFLDNCLSLFDQKQKF